MEMTITYTDYDGVEKTEKHYIKMRIPNFGKRIGYSNTPCPNCGRYRLENYENGKQVCEKCSWCPQDKKFIDRDDIFR